MNMTDEGLTGSQPDPCEAPASQSAGNETSETSKEGGSNAVKKTRTIEDFLNACGFEEVPTKSETEPDDVPAGSVLLPSGSDPPSPPPPPPAGFFDDISKWRSAPLSLPAATSNQRVAVFDFDQTLAVTQTTPAKLVDAVRRVFGGEGRVRMLRDLFEKLHHQGVVLVIASFNSKETIERALADPNVDLLTFFRHPLENMYSSQHFQTAFGKEDRAQSVLGAEVFDDMRDYRKSSAVAKVLTSLGAAPENLLFIDDNTSNCKDVETRIPGAVAMRIGMTEGQWGVGPLHCLHILRWAEYEQADAESAGWTGAAAGLEAYYSSTGTCSGSSSNKSGRSLSGLEAGLADLDAEWEAQCQAQAAMP